MSVKFENAVALKSSSVTPPLLSLSFSFFLFSQMKAYRKAKKRMNSRQLQTRIEPIPRVYLGACSDL